MCAPQDHIPIFVPNGRDRASGRGNECSTQWAKKRVHRHPLTLQVDRLSLYYGNDMKACEEWGGLRAVAHLFGCGE